MQALLNEATAHRAVNHPYINALLNGDFENMEEVLKDFATQYGYYSDWFPRYLTSVISKLENPIFRDQLLDNLSEERGHLNEDEMEAIRALGIQDEWVQGIAHPQLFKRFQKAIGVESNIKPCIHVEIWRDSFLSLTKSESSATVIGAIGLGTESIVKYIYKDLIQVIEKNTDLTLEEYVFFPLHTEVDDEHGLILLNIAEQMASESTQMELEIRKGMLSALNLRASFWDDMFERAKMIDKRKVLVNS